MSFGPEEYPDQLYTENQSKLLINLPRLSGTLSILGSGTIVFIVIWDRRRKLKRLYHRILLAYSSVDVLCSFNYALSSAVVPKGTPGVWNASGTVVSCELSGFITHFSFALGVYVTFITVYYVLVLRYRVREETLARRVEPWIHGVSFVVPLAFGILMWKMKMYNPTNVAVGWCFINEYPMNCSWKDDLDCQRGETYHRWLVINNVPFFIFLAIVTVSSILTYCKIRSTQRQGSQWSMDRRRAEWQIREAGTQAFLYVAGFVLTYLPFGIANLFGPTPSTRENRNFYFHTSILVKIFLPLHGFWNCFIYIRPRFSAVRKRRPQASSWSIFKNILLSTESYNEVPDTGILRRWVFPSTRFGWRASTFMQPDPSSDAIPAVSAESSERVQDDYIPEIYEDHTEVFDCPEGSRTEDEEKEEFQPSQPP